ncbi:MAG: BatA domain-containing protein [Balneolales bacterium]
MSFLNSFFFIAIIAAGIPLIIHLINFQTSRKVAFSTLVFFQELQKSTIRRLNLKSYLLLALRVFAITLLVFALARPFLPPDMAGRFKAAHQGQMVALLIDNGPSMVQIDESGPYMDQALRIAEEVIIQSTEESRFLIIPTHGELKTSRWMRKAEAIRFLEELGAVNKGGFPKERMTFIQERLREEPGNSGRVYWISDARKTHLDKLEGQFNANSPNEEYYPVTFVKVGDNSFQNIAVASVDLAGQVFGEGIPVGVSVTVQNFGDQPVHNSYLSLEIDGERLSQYEMSLAAGEERSLLFEVIPESAGSIRGKVILESGTYSFDHTRYFSIEVPKSRKVLLVGDEGDDRSRRSYLRPVLEAVFETGTQIEAAYADVTSIREFEFENFDAIILESIQRIPDYLQAELVQFVQQGRGLFIIPSEQGISENYNRFLQQLNAGSFTGMRGDYGRFEEIASFRPLDTGHLLTDDLFESHEEAEVRIDMPSIYHYWLYDRPDSPAGSVLLSSNLDEPLFIEQPFGDGMVLIGTMGFSPGWSNLSIKPIYAPLLYRMILYVVAWEYGGVREHILGNSFDRLIATNYGARVTMTLNGEEIRPETAITAQGIRIRYAAKEWTPGWLIIELDGEENTIGVNQNILESDFRALSLAEVENFLEGILPHAGTLDVSGFSETEIKSAMASISFGKEIWNWFIWLALVFLVTESIIAGIYKTENTGDKRG